MKTKRIPLSQRYKDHPELRERFWQLYPYLLQSAFAPIPDPAEMTIAQMEDRVELAQLLTHQAIEQAVKMHPSLAGTKAGLWGG